MNTQTVESVGIDTADVSNAVHVAALAGTSSLYRVLSALLSYPEAELVEALPEIRAALAAEPEAAVLLQPLLAHLESLSLIELQEEYVATFDRSPLLALHLFEHIHGESRDRGQAMVDLLQEYQRNGFEPAVNELPDHVPLFLEFLSLQDAEQATELLGDAIHVLAAIGQRLQGKDSAYAGVFLVLRTLTDVEPQEQTDPPIRDMDEAMEKFGPGHDGVEMLLKPTDQGVHTIHFAPRRNGAACN